MGEKSAGLIVAVLITLILAMPAAAQGPKEEGIPGLGRAPDAPEGIDIPEGMHPAFRTFIAGYAGFLKKIAGKEPGFRNTLQEIMISSGQELPPPVASWDDAADRLFGVFDLAYGQYKQSAVPSAASQSAPNNSPTPSNSATPAPPSGDAAGGQGLESTAIETAALAVGLTGLIAFMGVGGVSLIGWLLKLLVV